LAACSPPMAKLTRYVEAMEVMEEPGEKREDAIRERRHFVQI